MIILWSGAVVDIPDGWALCNGANDTPDLRNRFVVGAGDSYGVDDTGGNLTHRHFTTTAGHTHTLGIGDAIAAGADYSKTTDLMNDYGFSDYINHLPPYYALCYIMKLHDDPDIREWLAWPYAAKAIVQHAHAANVLEIWLTFRHKMNIDNKPPNDLWLVECDSVPKAITASNWLDQWTMKLTIDPLVGAPTIVTVEYDGPDDDLATTWDKQWEPWGPILSFDIG